MSRGQNVVVRCFDEAGQVVSDAYVHIGSPNRPMPDLALIVDDKGELRCRLEPDQYTIAANANETRGATEVTITNCGKEKVVQITLGEKASLPC